MPSLHNFWKLKACVRSNTGYTGGLLQAGGLKLLLNKGNSSFSSSSPLPVGSSSSCQYTYLSFWKFPSTNHCPAPAHLPLAADPPHVWTGKALSATESLSRAFSTPSVHDPLRQSCGFATLKFVADGGGKSTTASLRDLSEKGFLVLRSLPRCEEARRESEWGKRGIPEHVITSAASLRPDIWKERQLQERQVETDAGLEDRHLGGLSFEAKKSSKYVYRVKASSSLDDDGKEDKRADREKGNIFDSVHKRFTESLGIQRLLGMHDVFSWSIAFHFFHWTPALRNLYVRALHNTSLASVVLDRMQNGNTSYEREEDFHEMRKDIRALRLLSGACCLPHPNKAKSGGEDAYFICPDEQVIGVADGVGGWAELGVDAGEYARELMSQSMIAVRQEPHGFIDPLQVLLYAHSRTKCRGSSTACILALSDSAKIGVVAPNQSSEHQRLQAANIGDSGFLLVRNGGIIFKSPAQQHQFNMPFQLQSDGSDSPSAAEVFSLQVAAGDVIVAGTDGLFDNLYDSELTSVVVHSIRAGLGPQATAQIIVALARDRAQDRDRQTPFSTAAQDAGLPFSGGKMDDITVVVSYITNTQSIPGTPSHEP